jgi:hypothetical protein
MNYKKATVIFIAICVVSIIAWDAFVIINGGVETSISQTMIDWAYEYPIFSFSMGVVCGHLFWRISSVKKEVN